MKNILKKLHIVPSGAGVDDVDAGGSDTSATSSPPIHGGGGGGGGFVSSPVHGEPKPFSGLTSWLNSVTSRQAASVGPTPSSSSGSSTSSMSSTALAFGGAQRGEEGVVGVEVKGNLERNSEMDEESQIQLALEMSAREDPEAVQIEAVKQISLGCCDPENTAAEILAYRYWNYNSLSYDDKVLDGFYDIYGLKLDAASAKLPSLVDLQGTSLSSDLSCEVVIVNKKEDPDLLRLEQKVLLMAFETRADISGSIGSILVQKIAVVVANHMGGKVSNPESMSEAYRTLTNSLRTSAGNFLLPLGRITVGLARHRALLFKVLADTVGIPCLLLKGKQYTGSDDGALNIVKLNDGREYIVDLMAEPGTLVPTDGTGLPTKFEEAAFLTNPFSKDVKSTHMILPRDDLSSSASCPESELSYNSSIAPSLQNSDFSGVITSKLSNKSRQSFSSTKVSSKDNSTEERMGITKDYKVPKNNVNRKVQESSGSSNQPPVTARSPSWTEGISSPAVRRMKVKDVSEYMINAAKENPQLAQRLHDVLLESGVIAPANLFTEMCTEEPEDSIVEDANLIENKSKKKYFKNEVKQKTETEEGHGPFLPGLPIRNAQKKVTSKLSMEPLKPVQGLRPRRLSDSPDATSSQSASEASDSNLPDSQLQLIKHMPVAAAAATAAVVASSMVAAAAKTSNDLNLEVPVAAAAAAVTATAAAVVATTAAVSRQYEHFQPVNDDASSSEKNDVLVSMQQNSGGGHEGPLINEQTVTETQQESERISDRSTGTESIKSESALDDVAEFEIAWEDIILGERIGLGSFGEVYRGDWHGTEVAVKRLLHQDISSDVLEEFISEVQIMKRLRHPNVVLFMGAVIRVPNLSIVTEFLHRGSLFRLIHRPNNQLDERRRLRMALDVARGMNYLHNSTPVIVHRDLKSPNLLVDKNWVVKVCDFGLSRIKHNTFLSSRSTAGTAEWMAPEVLRNEPSDEKCDVFSFGVILWELCTMQQPWEGMNPMQVVGAVGFQSRRLDIPDDMDPVIADIIKKCWHTDPRMRPSFTEIMAALKPLQKPASTGQGMKQRAQ